jgi:hypothetical protein
MMCNRFKITRMTTITSRTCSRLPVFGMLGMYLGPKNPSAHKINKMTTIVHIIFLLEKYLTGLIPVQGMISSYNKGILTASIEWGGFIYAIWGRSQVS